MPELRPRDSGIMDNLSSHKGQKAREMIEAAGSTLLFLPPYSPDFNPIENGSVANRSFGHNEMVSRR